MPNTRTKAVVALGALDIARQVARAWAAREQARQDRFGVGLRHDVAQLAHDARERIPSHRELRRYGIRALRREPTFGERVRDWSPVAIVAVISSVAVVVAAKVVAQRDPELTPDEAATQPRVLAAVRSGSHAIDAGVNKVVEGGSAAAVGTASAVAAGSTAVRAAVVDRARHELDERVVAPAKKKAILFGSLGIVGLTVYVVLVATLTYLVIDALA